MLESAQGTIKKNLNTWPLKPPVNALFTLINTHSWPPKDSLFFFIRLPLELVNKKTCDNRQATKAVLSTSQTLLFQITRIRITMASKLNWPYPCLPFDVQAGGQMPQFSGRRYQHRPTGFAQTRTFIAARRNLGLGAALMLWLTGSPPVPNDPNKRILYPCLLRLSSAAAHSALPVRAFAHACVDRRCLWAITNDYDCQTCSICMWMFY